MKKQIRNIDTLERLYRQKRIEQYAYEAGRQFGDDFVSASLSGTQAIQYAERYDKSPTSTSRVEHAVLNSFKTRNAINALGGMNSPCGKVAWHVLGFGENISHWASGEGYDQKEARGILISALAILAKHYGFV